jgi:hypothetical protein
MLKLKNGFFTLNGKKYQNLNATEQLIFNLLFADQKNNLIMLCKPKNELSLTNLKNQNYEFRRLHRGNV